MSDAAKSQEDWNEHLADRKPAIMASSNALQILVGINSAVPFDLPAPFPLLRPNDMKGSTKKENKSYLRIIRRAGSTGHTEKGEKKPFMGQVNSPINFTYDRMRKQNLSCNGTSRLANVAAPQSEEVGQNTQKSRLIGYNVEANIRRDELRKVASLNAASLINCNGGGVQSKRDQATVPSAFSLNAPSLEPPLDFGSSSPLWTVPSKDNQTSQVSFPWIIPGLGQTMLLWQAYLSNLPQNICRPQPTNKVPVSNINFMRTRPNPSEILLYINDEMSSSFQMSVNFVRIPRRYERLSRSANNILEDHIIQSWVFVYMIDLASVKQSQNSIVAPIDIIRAKDATWTVVAFPTRAASQSSQRRTANGHVITRYELCNIGRWPLVDAQHANFFSWLPWVDAAAIGAAAIEFESKHISLRSD